MTARPKPGYLRVFADMVVNVSVQLEGKLPDWPNHIQDRVYKYFEAEGRKRGRNYQYWNSQSSVDGGVAFIHVVFYADVSALVYYHEKNTPKILQ